MIFFTLKKNRFFSPVIVELCSLHVVLFSLIHKYYSHAMGGEDWTFKNGMSSGRSYSEVSWFVWVWGSFNQLWNNYLENLLFRKMCIINRFPRQNRCRHQIFLGFVSDLDFLLTWANHLGIVVLSWTAKEFLYPFNSLQASVLQSLDKLHGEIQVLPYTDVLCGWFIFTPSLLALSLSRRDCALLSSWRSRLAPQIGPPGRILPLL